MSFSLTKAIRPNVDINAIIAPNKKADFALTEAYISPQKPELNRGIWKCLEKHVRAWAEQNELYIITAGNLKGDLSVIGKKNKVGRVF